MIFIPEGTFIMGSNQTNDQEKQRIYGSIEPFFLNQHPQHNVSSLAFWIDKYEVSNQSYKEYIMATNHPIPFYWTQNAFNISDEKIEKAHINNLRLIARDYLKLDINVESMSRSPLLREIYIAREEFERQPVTGVSWFDAQKYCSWKHLRLPTEIEWEKAARGNEGNLFPWGNRWDTEKIGLGDSSTNHWVHLPVDKQGKDRSVFGVYGLSGNVMEWVSDWYQSYAGSDYDSENFGEMYKVVRGGSRDVGHYALSEYFMGSHRAYFLPEVKGESIGFRCAKDT